MLAQPGPSRELDRSYQPDPTAISLRHLVRSPQPDPTVTSLGCIGMSLDTNILGKISGCHLMIHCI